MALTETGEALTLQHRRLQLRVRALAVTEVMALSRGLDPEDFAGSYDRLEHSFETVVTSYRRTSAGVASNYYRAYRLAEGVPGEAAIQLASRVPMQTLLSSMRVTGPIAFHRARRSGKTAVEATAVARTMLSGSLTRHVLNGGRETILNTIAADDKAIGWERVTSASPCAFCAMIAGRGAVFHTEATGGFQAHDHCGCTVQPRMLNDDFISERNRRFRDEWNQARREATASGDLRRGTSNDALNAFRRHYSG